MDPAKLPDDFYERIKPRLYRRIGRELGTAYRVLDLGCGNCRLTRYLRDAYQQRVTGVDTSDGKLPHCDDPARSRKAMRCLHADAEHLDFLRDARVDAVVAVWSVHEMEDAPAALREALRVLRPGGRILVVEFPRGSLADRLWTEDYFSAAEVEALLKDAGFQHVRVSTIEQGQVLWARGDRPPRADVPP
jgi:ubiquinone/menaquinone biosynthesis C-methylase UbiE